MLLHLFLLPIEFALPPTSFSSYRVKHVNTWSFGVPLTSVKILLAGAKSHITAMDNAEYYRLHQHSPT